MFPFWSIARLSLAKVEKVVKPPHRPVVNRRHQLLSVVENFAKMPYNSPIRKHPNRLTVRVPHGNDVLCPFIKVEMKYLAAPPIKLPDPTIRIAFSMV